MPSKIRKPKTDRKQNTACDACKLRRVKCEREHENADCRACINKKLRCVATLAQKCKDQQGTRLLEARSRYGRSDDDQRQAGSISPDPPYPIASGSGIRSVDNILPIPQFQDLSLVQKDNLARELIESFSTTTHYGVPITNWSRFSDVWETAEQRYSRLDPQTQVLAAYMVAFGARVSNHERIVGCIDCPLLLTAVEGKYTTSDLEYWGQRRASVCDALRTHADHLFNTREVMLKPTSLSITIAMLKMLTQHKMPQTLPSIDIQMTVALLKATHEDANRLFDTTTAMNERAETQRLSLLLMLYEAIAAAGTGASLFFTYDDFRTFCPSALESTQDVKDLVDQDLFPALKCRELILSRMTLLARFIRDQFTVATTAEARAQVLQDFEPSWNQLQSRLDEALSLIQDESQGDPDSLTSWWSRVSALWRWRIECLLRDRLREWSREQAEVNMTHYNSSYTHLLDSKTFGAETRTLQRLREYVVADEKCAVLMGELKQYFPLQPIHDLIERGAIDILEKPAEIMPEWTLEDQIKTVHVLFRKGPSLRYVWGSMPAVKIGDKVLELLEARKSNVPSIEDVEQSRQIARELEMEQSTVWPSKTPLERGLTFRDQLWEATPAGGTINVFPRQYA